jgi:hypothetical protein
MDRTMTTLFDVVTVACFAALVLAFFQLTDRQTRTLLHLGLAGVVFAVANQLGNAGSAVLALVLIVAGSAYAGLVIWTGMPGASR